MIFEKDVPMLSNWFKYKVTEIPDTKLLIILSDRLLPQGFLSATAASIFSEKSFKPTSNSLLN